jgi:hypothetical protein
MIQPLLAWELARKDLALFMADRRGMLLCFAVPILLASIGGDFLPTKGRGRDSSAGLDRLRRRQRTIAADRGQAPRVAPSRRYRV